MYADAARSALSSFIDYAGLFPPAELPMGRAVKEFVTARDGEHGWMLGRFLCPASRLEELGGLVRRHVRPGDRQFQVRVVSDGSPADDVQRARDFVASMAPPAEALDRPRRLTEPPPGYLAGFDMFEVRWQEGELRLLLDTVFTLSYVMPVVEVAPDRSVAAAVGAIADERERRGNLILAKIRCGGLTADAFPSPQQIAAFIGACIRAGLPFKATAGLHQPFRHLDEATGVTRHGFVNLRAAALLGRAHALDDGTLARIIDDRDAGNFELSRRALRWRDLEVTPETISELHWQSLVAYGSCDFAEPVDALTAAGILPVSQPPPPDPRDPGPVY